MVFIKYPYLYGFVYIHICMYTCVKILYSECRLSILKILQYFRWMTMDNNDDACFYLMQHMLHPNHCVQEYLQTKLKNNLNNIKINNSNQIWIHSLSTEIKLRLLQQQSIGKPIEKISVACMQVASETPRSRRSLVDSLLAY